MLREDSEKEDGIPLRAEFGELLRGISGLYLLTPFCFHGVFAGLILAPTCRSDGGSSVPRWPSPLPGDCAGAAGDCSGPVQRSRRSAMPGPMLLHRYDSGLSRTRTAQCAQKHTSKHGETVSTGLYRFDLKFGNIV